MEKWVMNKETGLLESPKLQEIRRKETIKNCVITIFIVLFCLSVITNIMLVRENKFLKDEVEVYTGMPDYNSFQD